MINLWVLPGGASNGAWQAGVIYALWERNILPDALACSSVGTLNGIMVATNQVPRMKDIWMDLCPDVVKKSRGNIKIGFNYLFHLAGIRKPHLGLFNNSPLRKVLVDAVLGREVKREIYSSVVMQGDKSRPDKYMKFNLKSGSIITQRDIDKMIASTSIPVYFDPVDIDGKRYFDGGVHHIAPMKKAIRKNKIKSLLAISCQPLNAGVDPGKDIPGIGRWTLNSILSSQIRNDWQDFLNWNEASKQANLVIGGVEIQHISDYELIFPEEDLGDPMDFSKKKSISLFEMGYKFAETTFENN